MHTDKFDKDNAEHARLKEGIEIGNGLPYVSDAQAVRSPLCHATPPRALLLDRPQLTGLSLPTIYCVLCVVAGG